jgi:hypothetical protein
VLAAGRNIAHRKFAAVCFINSVRMSGFWNEILGLGMQRLRISFPLPAQHSCVMFEDSSAGFEKKHGQLNFSHSKAELCLQSVLLQGLNY